MRRCFALPLPVLLIVTALLSHAQLAWADQALSRDDAIRVLRESTFFTDGPVGVAAAHPPELEALARVLEEPDAAEILGRLITGGSPSAKLYACIGLFEADRQAFGAAVDRLRGSKLEVEMASGCTGWTTTVGKLIGDSNVPPADEGADEGAADDIASGNMAVHVLEVARDRLQQRRSRAKGDVTTPAGR